jgi:hypothetical protein
MAGKALYVAAVQGDDRIGTAITGTFRTIVSHRAALKPSVAGNAKR